MLYSDDSYISKVRQMILQYKVTAWTDQHIFAAFKFEADLNARWYQQAAENAGYDPLDTLFVPENLLQGFTYIGTGTRTILPGDVVSVVIGHTAGGTVGNYYEALTASGSIDLDAEDFSGGTWEDKTEDRIKFRNCVSYFALHLAYEYLTKKENEDDYADQRDYFLDKYNKEFEFQLSQNIGYDWDGDGEIDSTEYSKKSYRLQRV